MPASTTSTLELQLLSYFVARARAQGITEDVINSALFTRLVRARVKLLQGPRGDWGGGGYTDIGQIPTARLERLAEEIIENMWGAGKR